MFSNIRLIAAAVGAAMMLFVGYTFGARKVHSLEEQLDKIRLEMNDANARLKKSEEEIAQRLKAQAVEYEKRAEQQKADSERRSNALAVALANANKQGATDKAKVTALNAQVDRMKADLDKAPASEQARRQAELDAAIRARDGAVSEMDSNRCLALIVPEQVVGPFTSAR